MALRRWPRWRRDRRRPLSCGRGARGSRVPGRAPAVGPIVATQTTTTAPTPLGQAGPFKHAINLDLLEFGPELNPGSRVALRIPLRFGFAGDPTSRTSFLELVIALGYVYRFHHAREQHWVPFVGGARASGAFEFGRRLLGFPKPNQH